MNTLIIEPDNYSSKALAIYRSLGKVYFGPHPRHDIHIAVARLAYKIDASWMDKMPNLKVIALPGTGLVMDFIDVNEAKKYKTKIVYLDEKNRIKK